MFQSLIRRAENAIESSIGNVVNRAIVAVPFVVAAGFGTAALSLWLNRSLGAEVGNLVMALVFCVVGAIMGLFLLGSQPAEAAAEAGEAAEEAASAAAPPNTFSFTAADRELLMSSMSTVAPLVLPRMARAVLRNLPLLAVMAVLAFILTRPDEGDVQSTASAQGHAPG